MFVKTVSTTSGINPIKFDETGGVFYWILNTGSSTVYASIEESFSVGDDGVVSLGPKESRRLETKNDTIYILGEGQVEIHNQRDGICSFKEAPTSSGGGETVDAYTKTESDAKYASKSIYGDNGINLQYTNGSIAIGNKVTATGNQSAAFGARSEATSIHTYAYGSACIASAIGARAIGSLCNATAIYSLAFGEHAETNNRYEVTFGAYNLSNEDTLFSIGDGSESDDRHNAFEITTDGGKLHDKDIATTDQIPTSLPANGGNADTLDNKHASDFVQALTMNNVAENYVLIPDNVDIAEWLTENAKIGNTYIRNESNVGQTNIPGGLDFWTYITYDGNRYLARVLLTSTSTVDFLLDYIQYPQGASIKGWKEISTTPIKSMTVSGTTNSYSDLALFTMSSGKIPIFIACDDVYCIPCSSTTGAYYAHMIPAHADSMVNVVIDSATVYYIQT